LFLLTSLNNNYKKDGMVDVASVYQLVVAGVLLGAL